jgi:Spy/CpxP family protein refolding chaperone
LSTITILALVLALSALPATAQTHGGGHHGAGAPVPYAGLEKRVIKALSPQQVSDLEAGRGMGLALPAELNGYPGPLHVLELAHALGLTPEQRSRTRALMDAMRAETIPIGSRLVREEAVLDRLFADRTVAPASLAEATRVIATSQGDLRAAHLRYHLLTAELLTPDQVAAYNRLRGYGAPR